MAQELINIGAVADDGTGDTIRGAGIKINNNFAELYASGSGSSQLTFIQNNISATESNSDIVLGGNGTGAVRFADLTIDNTINISDNDIKVNTSNADLVLTGSGTGTVKTSVADVNGGNIDGTTIGASSPAAGTFSTVSFGTAGLTVDGIHLQDSTISANASNSTLQLDANGSGYVSLNGINFVNADGSSGQVLRTNGSGQLSWFTSPELYDSSDLSDGTATITGDSSAQRIDSFDLSVYRSASYVMSISDSTANRFSVIQANVTHNGGTAYISTFGGIGNGTSDGSTVYDSIEFTAVINSGNVRVRAKVNNTNTQVIKFVRRALKV